MVEPKRGVIDDRLSTLMLNLLEKVNNIGFQTNNNKPFDNLSTKEIQLIEALGNKKASMGELAKLVNVKESTLTHLSDKLVKKGYLTREHSKKDRRRVVAHLTEKGTSTWKKQLEVKKKTIELIISALEFEEQVVILNVLERLNKLAGEGKLIHTSSR